MIRTTGSEILDITEVDGEARRHRPARAFGAGELPGRIPGLAASRPEPPPRHLRLRPAGRRHRATSWPVTGWARARRARRPARPCVPGYRRRTPPSSASPRRSASWTSTTRRSVALIEANRVDQVVTRYDTWASLRGYCALSANPVGRLVLAVFGADDARAGRRGPTTSAPRCSSSSTCRTWARTSPGAASTSRPRISTGSARRTRSSRPPRRRARSARVVAHEVDRARRLLHRAAPPLCRSLRGRARLAVAGFAGGGLAALDAIERARYDVLAVDARPSHVRTLYRTAAGRCRRSGRGMRRDDAYARCEEITRTEAKNFAYGIRLLPPPKRSAMSAIYAFARRIDDIGDGDGAPDEKLAELAVVRRDVDALRRGHAPDDDPVLVALADTGAALPACRWTPSTSWSKAASTTSSVPRTRPSTTLVGYCRLVAGSVGRLSLAVFGTTDEARAAGARRRPRRGAAAHQHPARRRRGPGDGPGLPAGRGHRPVRRRPRPDGTGRLGRGAGRASKPPGHGSGSTRACSCSRCSTTGAGRASAAMAGIYRRLLTRIDGPTRRRARGTRVAADVGEGVGRGPQHRRARSVGHRRPTGSAREPDPGRGRRRRARRA